MSHSPPDEILRELGRITWEAITVEDRVYQVAGHVVMDPENEPVGTCIGKTIKKLKRLGLHPDLAEAIAWLEEVRAALEDRNAVMHGLPMISYVRTASGTVAPSGADAIEYLGRRDRTVGRVIPLTVADLTQISSRLANVSARWQQVTIGVSQFRGVPWGPSPDEGPSFAP